MELEHLRQSEELKDVDAFKIRYEKFHQGKIDLIKVAHEEEMRTLVQRVSTLTESARAHEAEITVLMGRQTPESLIEDTKRAQQAAEEAEKRVAEVEAYAARQVAANKSLLESLLESA